MAGEMTGSERRWLHALLVLSTITVGLILLGLVANILVYFTDILLIFLLAWLLAFALEPVVSGILRAFPTLPRSLVVVFTYIVLLFALTAIVVAVAGSLAVSITGFVANLPDLQSQLPQMLAPWQERLNALGFRIDLVSAAQGALQGLGALGGDLVRPLTELALAGLGVFGALMLIIFLSLFIVIDKERIVAFLNRLVPPRYSDEARLFETSVASSFGGFLRGQAIQGVVYAAIAAVAHLVLGLEYMPASAALVGVSQAIPFFGPFFSWAPPVLVALLTKPDAVLPALVIMAIGWFVVMNIVQPRVMATAIGIHPIVVLASVLVGLKVAGIAGAIFGMPIAAILSSFFFYYLNRSASGPRDVASRAAKRLGEREGRRVRVPTPPPLPPTPPAGPGPHPDPGGGSARRGAPAETATESGVDDDPARDTGTPDADATPPDGRGHETVAKPGTSIATT